MTINTMKREAPNIVLSSIKLMFIRLLPFSTNLYNRSLCKLIDRVSDASFLGYYQHFIRMIKFTKRDSKRFRNSSKEMENVLSQFPRLSSHRGVVFGIVRIHRMKHKLAK